MSGAIPPRPIYNIRVPVHNVCLHKLKASCALKIAVFVWALLLSNSEHIHRHELERIQVLRVQTGDI